MRSLLILALLAFPAALHAETVQHRVNPIRKVVTMLQMMVNKVTAEGEKEEKMFDAFMCYCKGGAGTLEAEIDASKTKVTELESSIESGTAEKAQLDADLKAHKADRTAAEGAMAEATSLREKEAGAYATTSSDLKTNIAALGKATAAIEKGMGGSFLQTETGLVKTLKNLAMTKEDMADVDRQDLLSFLSNEQSEGYAPQSGQITGILKTMNDEMTADLSSADAAEASAIASFEELMAAKKKQVESLTAMVEDKSVRVGDLGVELAMQKNDLEDTSESIVEDTKFAAELEKACKTKQAEWDARCELRNQELLALADTIKILNDDDALELFKKTLPGSASFVQIQVTASSMRSKALSIINEARSNNGKALDFIALALRGKKVGFGKVLKMIDTMVATLKQEQADDDSKKEYCEKEFDTAEDEKKALDNKLSDLETAIDDAKEGISTAASEIEALDDGIKALDKSVAEATENRKEENEDYKSLMAGNGAAKELIAFAKNRMQKFYNPKLYKAPPKRELSEEERITLNMGGTLAPTAAPGGIAGTGVAVFVQISSHKSAPGPAPEADFSSKPKTEESGGVIAMMDMMIADLDKEMQVAEVEEKNAQEEYEQLMTDSADKRAEDSKSITDKESSKAELTAALEQHGEDKKSTQTALMENGKLIGALHGECDWLLKYFDARKEARTGEIDSLGKAKAVLSGADFSLLQTGRALRR